MEKIEYFTSLPKKNDKQIFENYRPISLLPIFSKTFEKIIFNKIQFPSKRKTLKSKPIWFSTIRFMHKPIAFNHTRHFSVF